MSSAFPHEGLEFLKDLEKNNNRAWFHGHKSRFEQHVKGPMQDLVEAINGELRAFAPSYVTEPKKAISRINRDTRFSRDKSPYKTEVSAVFPCKAKEKHEAAGFYFGLSPREVDVVGGAYMPGPEQLAKIRKHLGSRHSEFREAVESKRLRDAMGELLGEQQKRVPREFPADHPGGAFLRQKQFYFRARLGCDLVTSKKLVPDLVGRFRVMAPFVTWLDRAMGNIAS